MALSFLKDCTHTLYEQAIEEYQKTDSYALYRERTARMETECDCILSPTDKQLVETYLALLQETYETQASYLYRHGLADGIAIFNYLGSA